ncbi:cupin domain-containing protein [uncultured Sneathia sp.]|uniref:cupin domain-containing protein n=1 Tax=uncultured Sneathia sp. TaxID=278067 RepID=UPI00280585E2|nr:cupin domain-containing protein [uncultured Sneathia sp.]
MSEVVKTIYDKEVRIERIYSNNASTDWMVQDIDELVYLLNGSAILEYTDKEIPLDKDSFEYIKKGVRHRVKSTSEDCIWLCVFIKC